MTVNHDVAGSNPASGASGLFVKRLRHRPFTAGSGVRIPHRSPWAISSAGRASALQAECQQFDPVIAHQNEKTSRALRREVFFLLYLSSHYYSTSCIRAHDHLRVTSLLQMMFAAEPVRSCYRPPKRRPHVIRSMGSFFLPFSFFSLRSYDLLHPRLTTFCASLRSFKMCSLRNQFDPVIAHHNEKFHVLCAVGFFIALLLRSG